MTQEEFFEAIKRKKLKEAVITLDCGCRMLYSGVTQEIFAKPCSPAHADLM